MQCERRIQSPSCGRSTTSLVYSRLFTALLSVNLPRNWLSVPFRVSPSPLCLFSFLSYHPFLPILTLIQTICIPFFFSHPIPLHFFIFYLIVKINSVLLKCITGHCRAFSPGMHSLKLVSRTILPHSEMFYSQSVMYFK